MVCATGPTAHSKKSADATINGFKLVCIQKKKTAPKSKTPTPLPTKGCVHKSVLEQLDAAFQPFISGRIVILKYTATRMGSAEQLEMELDEEADELEGESFDSDPGLNDNEVMKLSDDDNGEVATSVNREVHLSSSPPTDLKKLKAKGKEKQAQTEDV
jgi:hypothetical protein